jgi:O-antigen/teichoic acid export membrane protein
MRQECRKAKRRQRSLVLLILVAVLIVLVLVFLAPWSALGAAVGLCVALGGIHLVAKKRKKEPPP